MRDVITKGLVALRYTVVKQRTTDDAKGNRLWKTYGNIQSTAYNHHAKITYSAIPVA